jgi:hypothetical protein
MEDNAVKELVNEIIALRTTNTDLQSKVTKYEEMELSYSFQRITTLSDGITIRGVLIGEGVWKGVKYTYELMKSVYQKFIGLAFDVDHGHGSKYGRRDVGKVINVIPNDNLKVLEFEGKVTDPQAISDVECGNLDAVSIKGAINVDAGTPPTAITYEPMKVSLTNSPACVFCNIFNAELSMFNDELAVWTTAYVNNLPDSAFAYISPGGKKDKDGKTEPRSLRHLPYKDSGGKVDPAHVRNALARLSQTQIPDAAKSSAKAKLLRAAKGIGVHSENSLNNEDDIYDDGEEINMTDDNSTPPASIPPATNVPPVVAPVVTPPVVPVTPVTPVVPPVTPPPVAPTPVVTPPAPVVDTEKQEMMKAIKDMQSEIKSLREKIPAPPAPAPEPIKFKATTRNVAKLLMGQEPEKVK